MRLAAKAIIWIVALFYTYGAIVHAMNMLGLSGFDWSTAPRKWQVLDVCYLAIDIVVAVGFFAGWRIAYPAFFAAASSQIVLYTLLRDWIIDVPAEFAVAPEQVAYLDSLVLFHVITIALVGLVWWLTPR